MRGGRWLHTRVAKLLAYWIPRLGLAPWVITARWKPTKRQREMFPRAIAMMNRFPRSLAADVTFNERVIKRDVASDFELEVTVVHELVHVLTNLRELETNALATALVRERRGM
jgi:hypothetical protein